MKPLGEFVYYRTYSRWLSGEKRREYWWETVRRAVEYNCRLVTGVTTDEAERLYDNIYNLRQFPSGRTLWLGGTEIAEQYGAGNYNCAFCIIDGYEKFSELFYLLMIGTGVGFRVLKTDVEKIPPIRTNVRVIHEYYKPLAPKDRHEHSSVVFDGGAAKITVGDSKEGWTKALEFFFAILHEHSYHGIHTIVLNYDNVRPKGERLKRFGGTASGHESMKTMFEKICFVLEEMGREENGVRCCLRPIH